MNDEKEGRVIDGKMIEDLQKQVQSLLRQQVESTNEMNYADVKGLQEKNMELMRRVKELEKEEEDRQKQEETNGMIVVLQNEIEAIKKDREQQQELMNTLTKQRDMYRVLLAEKDASAIHSDDFNNTSNNNSSVITDLKEQLQSVSKQYAKSCSDYEEKTSQLTLQLQDKDGMIISLQQKNELEQENIRVMKETIKQLESSISILESKNKQQEGDIILYQQSLISAQNESNSRQQRITSLSGENASLQQQVKQLSSSLEALKETKDQWQEERKKLRLIIDEVQEASNGLQLQYHNNLIEKQQCIDRLEARCKEMETELDELRSLQISRLNEVGFD